MSVGSISPASAESPHSGLPAMPVLSALSELPVLSDLLSFLGLTTTSGGPVSQDATHLEGETIRLLNDYRSSHGLSRLSIDPQLVTQARSWSQQLAAGAQFAHSPHNVAENIAMNSHAGPETFFNQWKNSPAHNSNMLKADATSIGVGVAFDNEGKAYSTMQLSS